jgi:hypothetical protein
MATFRYKAIAVALALIGIACMSPASAPAAAPIDEAKIQKIEIEHVVPRRDFVGPTPSRFEWTSVAGADSYAIAVENEVDMQIFEQAGITTTSTPWPKGFRVEPGTYFWRIAAFKGDRMIADSGRAAFVVQER